MKFLYQIAVFIVIIEGKVVTGWKQLAELLTCLCVFDIFHRVGCTRGFSPTAIGRIDQSFHVASVSCTGLLHNINKTFDTEVLNYFAKLTRIFWAPSRHVYRPHVVLGDPFVPIWHFPSGKCNT